MAHPHIYPSVAAALHGLADFFVAQAAAAIAARGRFSVALSGGSSPKKLYELLASEAYRDQVPWAEVYFFFGDERDVPVTDPQSNYLMAKTALLDPLSIPPAHVFAVNTALPPAEAAQAYTEAIQGFFGSEAPRLDLVLLGVGDNSHTASLFPHTAVLHVATASAEDVFVEELQAHRITLTAPLSIPPAHVFAVNTALPPAEAAQAYTEAIQGFFGSEAPRLDLVLLGVGDNSHTASLFPHTAVLHVATASAEDVFVEELQAHRITLTAPLINQAHAVAFLVYGADKAAAVQSVINGARDIEEYPAQLIAPTEGELHWFLDEAAAAKLP